MDQQQSGNEMSALVTFELKSFLSNRMSLFWTIVYPIAMLAFLVIIFDTGLPVTDFTKSYRFQATVGLVSLTIASTALFGMGQAMSDMRTNRALVPYLFLPCSIVGIISAILVSRIIVIVVFSFAFIVGAFLLLGIHISPHPMIVCQVSVSILVTSLFCFALVLPVVAVSNNSATIIALANMLNIYALLSSSVFIPMNVVPPWAVGFITTSPFYHLNIGLQAAFVNGQGVDFWLTHMVLVIISIGILYFSSHRRMMVPA